MRDQSARPEGRQRGVRFLGRGILGRGSEPLPTSWGSEVAVRSPNRVRNTAPENLDFGAF